MGQVLHGSARTTAAVRRAIQRSQESMRALAIGLDGGKIVIRAQVTSPTSIGFYVKLGSTVDVMEASSGNVILAHQTDEERDRRLTEWKRRTGKKVPTGLEGHLDRIRKAGYEKRANYQVQGVRTISFPVCDERGSALAALTIPYIEYGTSSVRQKNVIVSLEKAAREIDAAIGGKSSRR